MGVNEIHTIIGVTGEDLRGRRETWKISVWGVAKNSFERDHESESFLGCMQIFA